MDLGLVAHTGKPRVLAAIASVRRAVASPHRLEVWEPAVAGLQSRADYAGEIDGLSAVSDLARCDAVVSLGGDGTLLAAVRALGGAQRPLLGVNLGSLGFLTDTAPEGLVPAIESLLAGRYRLDPRMLLEASFPGSAPRVGLNDVVVHGPRARVLELAIRVGGTDLGATLADGVIVATPSGSTAYSLSAGGPIVSPHLQALVVTPISPHTLSVRPLVVAAEESIEVELVRSASENAAITIDGQASGEIAPGERLRVRRAARDAQLVVTTPRDFYDRLRTKLGWGLGRRGTGTSGTG